MVKVLHWAGRLKAAKDQRSAKDGCLPSGNQAGHLEIPKGNGGFRLKYPVNMEILTGKSFRTFDYQTVTLFWYPIWSTRSIVEKPEHDFAAWTI